MSGAGLAGILAIGSVFSALPTTGAGASSATLAGTVYQDRNGDGQRSAGEPAVAGVTVTAYDAMGASVGVATSQADGTYSVAAATSDAVRVEFTNLPSGVVPARRPAGATVRFTAGGDATLELAVERPADACAGSARVAVTCFTEGLPGGTYGSTPGIVVGGAPVLPFSSVGTTFGLAHARSTDTLFAGAYLSRHSGTLGGLGAIYRVGPGGAVSTLATLDAGVVTRPTTDELLPSLDGTDKSTTSWFYDAAAYGQVGKAGLGDLDISDDESTLYVVNLASRTVEFISTATGAATRPSAGLPQPAGCGDVLRPFGLGTNDGKLYVGAVCTGESTGAAPVGYVFEMADPASGSFAGPVLTVPFGSRPVDTRMPSMAWKPWTDGFLKTSRGNPLDPATTPETSWAYWPTPMLSDIDFVAGDMVVGVRDRRVDQQGIGTGDLSGTTTNAYDAVSAGDVLAACRTGAGWSIQGEGGCRSADEFYSDSAGDQLEPAAGSVAANGTQVAFTAQLATGGRQVRINDALSGAPAGGFDIDTVYAAKANGLGDIEFLCEAAKIEIGDRVWSDDNGNGVQDPGEPGIAGVAVNLTKGGAAVAQTTTDGDGYYVFGGLDARTAYEVVVANGQGPLDGLTLTEANDAVPSPSGSDLNDSDAVPGASGSVITLTTGPSGTNDHTFDVGFVGVYSLGNRVWNDVNDNGQIDAGETGIEGVRVSVLADANMDGTPDSPDAPVASTSTDANGYYRFDGLRGGSYVVRVDASNFSAVLAGRPSSGPTSPTPEDAIDRDDNGLNPTAAGQETTTGILSGVVKLGPGSSEPLGETDRPNPNPAGEAADGRSNLTVDFGFTIVAPPTTTTTAPASTTTVPSPTTTTVPDSTTTTTVPGPTTTTVPSPTTTTVPDSTTTTVPDTTTTTTTVPDSTTTTAPSPTTTTTLPSPTTTVPGPTTTVPDSCARAALGDRTFVDLNGNGVQDGNDPDLAGVTVRLTDAAGNRVTDCAGSLVADIVTGDNGLYRFTNLPAGSYRVTFTGPAGLPLTLATQGTNRAADSDAVPGTNPSIGTSATVTLANREDNPTIDAGFIRPATLGDRVWFDANLNGQQDSGEAGTPGVRVVLLDAAGLPPTSDAFGRPIGVQLTVDDGRYLFTSLRPGTYSVRFENLPGPFTVANIGNDGTDSDADPTTGRSTTVTLASGDDDRTVDAGWYLVPPTVTVPPPNVPLTTAPTIPPVTAPATTVPAPTTTVPAPSICSVGDTVWLDTNGNGAQDNGEAGIAGVTVVLQKADGTSQRTTTDGSGRYRFSNLACGTVTVTVDVTTLPQTATLNTYDLDGNRDSTTTVVLTGDRDDVDFGYQPLGGIMRDGADQGPTPAYTGGSLTLVLWATALVLFGFGLFGLARDRKRVVI